MSLTDNLLAKYRELHPPPPVPVPKKTAEEEAIIAQAIKTWTPNWTTADELNATNKVALTKTYEALKSLGDNFRVEVLKKSYMKADDFFTNSYKADDLLDL